jgi:hypothetical protein
MEAKYTQEGNIDLLTVESKNISSSPSAGLETTPIRGGTPCDFTRKCSDVNHLSMEAATMIDYLQLYVPLKNCSLIWKPHGEGIQNLGL